MDAASFAEDAESKPLNWRDIVRASGLEGPIKMIAAQAQVLSLSEDCVKLRLGVAALATESNRRLLSEKLSVRLGHSFRVVFEVGELDGDTVADEERRERYLAHRALIEGFRKDPFVTDVAKLFEGTIDEDSIERININGTTNTNTR